MKAFLFWFSSFLPFRRISEGDRPYLERYYLGQLFGYTFYLHRFVDSDPDRGVHDHPWRRAFSIILSGSYWEEYLIDDIYPSVRKVTRFNTLTESTFHRVVIDVPCWTLFFHTSAKIKPWGFLRNGKYEEYLYVNEGNQNNWWTRAKTRNGRNPGLRYFGRTRR